MLDITTDLDRACGALRFECVVCRFQMLATEEPDCTPPPCGPTIHAAGSPEKVEVMRTRANKKESLFHPDDSSERAEPKQESNRAANRTLPAGVTWDERNHAYRARITLAKGGARVFLGLFDDLPAAARAVELALAGDVAGAKALARRSGHARRTRDEG